MDFDEEFELEHLLFHHRKCRSCFEVKDLMSDFYKTRRGSGPSAYSYECSNVPKNGFSMREKRSRKSGNGNILTGSVFIQCFPNVNIPNNK